MQSLFEAYLIICIGLNFVGNVYCHEHTAYNHDTNGLGSNPNWMSKLDDNTRINHVSIPGTHDTMADDNDGDLVDCQDSDLPKQLEAGIRALDIRCRAINGVFAIHHGAYYLSADFDDVLNECKQFLQDHPREFIIMRVQQEYSEVSDAEFTTIFRKYWDNANYSPYFWKSSDYSTIPTVGQVRGKIVILPNWEGSGSFGLHWDRANIQDEYQLNTQYDLYSKWTSVKQQLNNANGNAASSKYYINFLSGAGCGGCALIFPYFVASGHSNPATGAPRLATGATTPGMKDSYPDFPRVDCVLGICTIAFEGTNILTYDYIRNYALEFVGIIYADFPGQALIDTIIHVNFPEYYMFRSKLPGNKCLSVHIGGDTAGGHIQIEDCNPSNDAQLWEFAPAYQIKNKRYGRCMDVYGGNMNEGDTIGVHGCRGASNQKWIIDTGSIRLYPDRTHCLDISGGDRWAIYHNCHGGNNQLFDYFLSTLYYFTLISKLPGSKCLDIYEGSDANLLNHIQLHSCHNGDNQIWSYDLTTKQIKSKRDGQCIDVYGGNMNEGDTIGVHECNGGNNQKWLLESNGQIKSVMGGCIDIWSGDTWAKYHSCHTDNNQLFEIKS